MRHIDERVILDVCSSVYEHGGETKNRWGKKRRKKVK